MGRTVWYDTTRDAIYSALDRGACSTAMSMSARVCVCVCVCVCVTLGLRYVDDQSSLEVGLRHAYTLFYVIWLCRQLTTVYIVLFRSTQQLENAPRECATLNWDDNKVTVLIFITFLPLCYACAVLAMALCPCLSQVGVLSKWMNESSWFLACELPSTRPTLC